MLVLGIWPRKMHDNKQTDSLFINMLLEDFVSISNLTAVFALNEPTYEWALERILARFSILLLGADTLTPMIIEQVWGQNKVARRNLGRPHCDLALICCQLILLACIPNNTYHLWLTTTFKDGTIIPPKTLQYLPPGIHDILQIVTQNDATIYVCKPLQPGQDQINILQHNLCQHPANHISSNCVDIIISWYHDLLLSSNHSTNTTGI